MSLLPLILHVPKNSSNLCKFLRNKNSLFSQNVQCLLPKRMSTAGGHPPKWHEKVILVWMKKYPSMSAIPETVSPTTMKMVYDWARIKISVLMCVLAASACVYMIYKGKKAAKGGESLRKINQRFHEDYEK